MKSLFCLFGVVLGLNAHAQIADPDFEQWHIDTIGKKRLSSWEHLIAGGGANLFLHGTWQDSSTSQSGQKAVILSRWYNYTWDVLKQKAPINHKPALLKGYYKYVDNDLTGGWAAKDTALIEVFLTAWNSTLNKRDTVGAGRKELTAANGYLLFSCTLSYSTLTIPDTIAIRFQPTKFVMAGGMAGSAPNGWGSFLTIDNLSLEQSTAVEHLSKDGPAAFPNPATDVVLVDLSGLRTCSIRVTDVTGREVYRVPAASGHARIDVRPWNAGIYFLRIDRGNSSHTVKIIKQK